MTLDINKLYLLEQVFFHFNKNLEFCYRILSNRKQSEYFYMKKSFSFLK